MFVFSSAKSQNVAQHKLMQSAIPQIYKCPEEGRTTFLLSCVFPHNSQRKEKRRAWSCDLT